jgi:PTS system nitrogen regulatory IIA component
MSVLSSLFHTDGINLNVLASSKAQAFKDASQYFAAKFQIPANTVIEFLNAREELGSTALGNGVAIPHGRIRGLHQPLLILVLPMANRSHY